MNAIGVGPKARGHPSGIMFKLIRVPFIVLINVNAEYAEPNKKINHLWEIGLVYTRVPELCFNFISR